MQEVMGMGMLASKKKQKLKKIAFSGRKRELKGKIYVRPYSRYDIFSKTITHSSF